MRSFSSGIEPLMLHTKPSTMTWNPADVTPGALPSAPQRNFMQNHLIITSNGAVWTLFATKRNRCPKVPADHPGDSRDRGLAVSLSGESTGSVKGAGVDEKLRNVTKSYEKLRNITKSYSGESMGSVKGAGVGGGRYEHLWKITNNYDFLRKVKKY